MSFESGGAIVAMADPNGNDTLEMRYSRMRRRESTYDSNIVRSGRSGWSAVKEPVNELTGGGGLIVVPLKSGWKSWV
jgi:hypothetical protein